MAAHLHWRVLITATHGSGATNCARCEMRTSAGGANAATGGTPSASNALGGYPASSAFDGNNSTFWVSPSGIPAWLRYSFAAAVDIVELVWRNRPDGYTNESPSAFSVQWSDDGTNWTTEKSFTTPAWAAGEQRTFTVQTTPAPGPFVEPEAAASALPGAVVTYKWGAVGTADSYTLSYRLNGAAAVTVASGLTIT
jgi:hypothetical protein